MGQPPPGDREGNQDMPTVLKTNTVIVSARDAAVTPQAPGKVVDGTAADPTGRRGHARRGVAELIDVAIAGVYPSTTAAHKQGGGF
jgi:hypothetical protein